MALDKDAGDETGVRLDERHRSRPSDSSSFSSCNGFYDHLYTICVDGIWSPTLAGNVHRLRDRPGETEKITVNIGYVDLGHIDLLVNEGFYSNRTDLIRTAIRNQLAAHGH
jgi:Ribbon-Helix-Helix transcriptional regulator family